MSIATTIAALQAKHLTISGVKTAPTAMPSVLNTATLPIVLVWPAECTWNPAAIDALYRRERVYVVNCYVSPVAQDKAGPENSYVTCSTLLDAFGLAYLADTTLGGAVDTMMAMSDTGVVASLQWGEVPYWGFTYRLSIVEKG